MSAWGTLMRGFCFLGGGGGEGRFCFDIGSFVKFSVVLVTLQVKYQVKVKWGKGAFQANLISHTLAHIDKDIHPQGV